MKVLKNKISLPLVCEIVRNALSTRNVLTPDKLATYGVIVSQLNNIKEVITLVRQNNKAK